MKKKTGIILLIVAAAAVAGIITVCAVKAKEKKDGVARFMEVVREFPAVMEEKMPEYIDDPLVEDVEVHARSRFSENRDGYHDWQEEVTVTLVVSDELDTYSQRDTYDTLRRLYQMVRTVRSEVLRKELPGYSGYINGEADKLFDEWISPNGRTEVYAETSRNLYRCPSGVVNDYYEVNGKGV